MDYKQIKAIEARNKQRWLEVNRRLTDASGIYILTRHEDGFKYAYIGQAKHLLTRLASHLTGYQHIDLSLRKHGLRSATNKAGWDVQFITYPVAELDKREQEWTRAYADMGYQLRNKTGGGQGEGKQGLDVDKKEGKGYYDGKKQGYKDAQRFVASLFKTNLKAEINGKEGVRKQKALQKFLDFIQEGENGSRVD